MSLLLILGCGPGTEYGSSSSEAKKPHVDETLVWNQTLLTAIPGAGALGNPQTIRMSATVNTAMFDAGNSVGHQRYTPIFVTERAPHGTHRRAAIVQAAYRTLKAFYPSQTALFDAQRAASLAEFSHANQDKVNNGIAWGDHVADLILAWRATDGFTTVPPVFTGLGGIGVWQSAATPPANFAPANISFTAPFVVASNDTFQSEFAHPWAALTSQAYADSVNEVAVMGVKTGSGRTDDDRQVAWFFNGYATTDYVEAAIQMAEHHRTSRRENSRIFALLCIAMHDTSVTVFRAKRDFAMDTSHVTWRPVKAIPQADLDGNPNTSPIAGWVPLINTPNHPEYPASHGGSHGSGPFVLTHFFGDANEFELHPVFNSVSPAPPEGAASVSPRHYTRVQDLRTDGIDARIFGGMHFRGCMNETARVGEVVSDYVLESAAQPIDDDEDSDSDSDSDSH
jgi:hypothetical protein